MKPRSNADGQTLLIQRGPRGAGVPRARELLGSPILDEERSKPRKLILLDEMFDTRDRRSMSSALGERYSFSKAASSALTAAGAIAMSDDAGVELVVFPDLGVAAGDFNSTDLQALANKGIIDEADVFDNETRSLPPLVIEDSPYALARPRRMRWQPPPILRRSSPCTTCEACAMRSIWC